MLNFLIVKYLHNGKGSYKLEYLSVYKIKGYVTMLQFTFLYNLVVFQFNPRV